MENQLIKIEDLQIGDEILTLTQQGKYLKVMEVPRKSKTGYTWRPGVDRYINVKCRVNVDITHRQGTKWSNGKIIPYIYDIKKYKIEPPQQDSPIEKFDLNFKELWLVKREI